MKESDCGQCIHFRQHYVVDSQRCTPVDCGHCTYPRLKKRRPDTPACIHYARREDAPTLPDRWGVIDFLTVDMLKHILELPLPPEVEGK